MLIICTRTGVLFQAAVESSTSRAGGIMFFSEEKTTSQLLPQRGGGEEKTPGHGSLVLICGSYYGSLNRKKRNETGLH